MSTSKFPNLPVFPEEFTLGIGRTDFIFDETQSFELAISEYRDVVDNILKINDFKSSLATKDFYDRLNEHLSIDPESANRDEMKVLEWGSRAIAIVKESNDCLGNWRDLERKALGCAMHMVGLHQGRARVEQGGGLFIGYWKAINEASKIRSQKLDGLKFAFDGEAKKGHPFMMGFIKGYFGKEKCTSADLKNLRDKYSKGLGEVDKISFLIIESGGVSEDAIKTIARSAHKVNAKTEDMAEAVVKSLRQMGQDKYTVQSFKLSERRLSNIRSDGSGPSP
jgi:hypothetical protein